MPQLKCSIKLCEKCSNMVFFWSVFSPNAGEYGPEKLGIWTIFSVCSITKAITKYSERNTLNDDEDKKKHYNGNKLLPPAIS